MIYFFLVVHGVWVLGHVYVARRLIPLVSRRWLRRMSYALLAFLCFTGLTVFQVDKLSPSSFVHSYRLFAWAYTGAFSTVLALMLVRELVLLLDSWRIRRAQKATAQKIAPNTAVHEAPDAPSAERRSFLLKASGGALVGTSVVLGGVGFAAARRVPKVFNVEVKIPGLPEAFDGYHIVQLSDIHVGHSIDKDFILPIVEQVTSLAPDLVALTGDLVDGSVDLLRADVSPLAYLRAKDGVFGVTGNHEYYSGVETWCAHFRELGITMLNNQHVAIERGGKRLILAGVTDHREGKRHAGHLSDPAGAIQGAPEHDVRILLAHQPKSAFEASKHGYALQLSGHTHGGQFFPWNLVVKLIEPLNPGLGELNGMPVYVNRGTCYWGPPLRTVPAEITSLKLRRA